MAIVHYSLAVPVDTSNALKASIFSPPSPGSRLPVAFCSSSTSSSLNSTPRSLSVLPSLRRIGHRAMAKPEESELSLAADAFTQFKHLLLPITDQHPYLSEGTRQDATLLAHIDGFRDMKSRWEKNNGFLVPGFSCVDHAAATTTALAKKYGADITVVVIDEKQKESLPEHDKQLSSLRWHLSEGGFQEFKLLERLGEGKKPTAIIGEVADDLNLDLVVMSMEAIHSKHVDANLLAEFIPCPVLLLPL